MKDTSSPIQNIFRVYNYCHMLYNYNLCYRIFDVNMTILKKQIRIEVWRFSIDDWILSSFFFTIFDFRKKKFLCVTVLYNLYVIIFIRSGGEKKRRKRNQCTLKPITSSYDYVYRKRYVYIHCIYIYIYTHTRFPERICTSAYVKKNTYQ